MVQNLPSHASRFAHSVRGSSQIRYTRLLSTFKTASGRVLPITKDIPTPVSQCNCDIHFPSGLKIDHDRPLINTVASYNRHIVIATGKNDWASKIENEEGVGEMARALKDMTKAKGEWFDVGLFYVFSWHTWLTEHDQYSPTIPP